MLRSTYAPPPPLPPGWTEHKAPAGTLRLGLRDLSSSLTVHQVSCIIIIPKLNSRPIRDRSLSLPSRNSRAQLLPMHHFSLQILYPRSRLRHTHRKDLDLELASQKLIINKVHPEEDFVVEKRIKIANPEHQRIGRSLRVRYLDANPGCS